jgi:hypothetical protein
MSDRWESMEPEWELAVNTASFYGVTKAEQRSKMGKQKKHVGPPPDLEFEEAGWAGGLTGDGKKSKAKKSKAVLPTYNTAEELYEALADLIARVPPTAASASSGPSTTLASLGDKLQTLTKQQWNKRYKSEFGTLRSFLSARPKVFSVEGDWVRLVQQSGKQRSRKSNGAQAASAAHSDSQQGSEEEEDSENDADQEGAAASAGSPRAAGRQQRSAKRDSSGSSICRKVTTLLLLVAGGVGALLFTGHLKLPQ